MKYKELLNELSKLTSEQLNMDVTISCDIAQEAIPATHFTITRGDDILGDVLDVGHPVIAIDY